jgi:glycosyltransferase involved in cell wall biosynthesis
VRVLMISKACVSGAYQRKLEAIAACPQVDLTVVVPPEWRDERGVVRLERVHTLGYELAVEPAAFNGSYHLHFYPRLGRRMARLRPEIVHIDEEPYNLATWQALRLARRYRAKTLFFSWQNLQRAYPFPFSAFERDVLDRADAAIVGSRGALEVWRAKGYLGPISVIPQFGVDPDIFRPHPSGGKASDAFVLGYAGRLVPEKGIDLLLRALVTLPPHVRVHIRGAGPERPRLERLAAQLAVTDRVTLDPHFPSTQMPGFFAQVNCLVLPSRTRPNWKEQFGRVLIEAMACGVPVIGSTCGEIPNVIGEAGLVFPEGDADALASRVLDLLLDPGLRARLSAAGRARVLAHYTQKKIAERTVAVYRSLAAT